MKYFLNNSFHFIKVLKSGLLAGGTNTFIRIAENNVGTVGLWQS